jgi:hypothetical protein
MVKMRMEGLLEGRSGVLRGARRRSRNGGRGWRAASERAEVPGTMGFPEG